MLVGCSGQLNIKACIKDVAGGIGTSDDAGEPVAGLWNFFVAAGVRCAGKTGGPTRWQPCCGCGRTALRRIIGHFPRIVIACNTASTIALSDVRSALDLPIVGTVPAVKPAALLSKTRVIGILGTEATVRQPYVDQLVEQFASDCTVVRHGSADLVDIAEAKLRGQPASQQAIQAALAGLYGPPGAAGMDAVVLACTHFPLLAEEIRAASPKGISLVDSGEGIARRTVHLTQGQTWADSPEGLAVFTREDESVRDLAKALQAAGLSRTDFL